MGCQLCSNVDARCIRCALTVIGIPCGWFGRICKQIAIVLLVDNASLTWQRCHADWSQRTTSSGSQGSNSDLNGRLRSTGMGCAGSVSPTVMSG